MMVTAGHALCVPGNHDVKFVRAARGRKVQLTHGLARTMEQYALRESVYSGELVAAVDFLDRLVSHYVLDEGRLVVAHAGLIQPLQGRSSGTVREFCLYGDVTGVRLLAPFLGDQTERPCHREIRARTHRGR
jgi:protein phosphatase